MEELIAWSVKLGSGTATIEDEQAFQHWRAKDPVHETAWQKLHAIEQGLNAVPPKSKPVVTQAMTLVGKPTPASVKRMQMFKQVGVGAAVFCTLAMLFHQFGSWQLLPWHQQSHFATAMGQRATFTLSDGTRLTLNTDTSVDINYALLKREIVLKTGEIYLETGKDTQGLFGRRSFWVDTQQVKMEAIGTKFSVYQYGTNTRLHVTEGIVAMHSGQHPPVRAYTNESYKMQGNASLPIKADVQQQDPLAWLDGVVVAKQMRLNALMSELLRYQALPLQYDADVGNLQVSGVFQLNRVDPAEHALQTIAQTLPIRLSKHNDSIIIRKK